MRNDLNDDKKKSPILLTTFVLQIPNIMIIPPIEELQFYFGKLVVTIVENHKKITAWGQRDVNRELISNESLFRLRKMYKDNKTIVHQLYSYINIFFPIIDGMKNYYQIISDHKEIVRCVMSLQGAIMTIKEDIEDLCNVLLFSFFSTLEYHKQISNNRFRNFCALSFLKYSLL